MSTEIKIKGVPPKVKEELRNISKNLGTNLGDFLKPYLRKILDEYPQNMRQEPPKH